MGTRRHGFVTGGTWCVDYNRTLPFWPGEEMATPVSPAVVRGGGCACNLAIDIRKLDPALPVETIGLVGDDHDGRFLHALADQHGIRRAQLASLDGAATNVVEAFQSVQSGRRSHLYCTGVADRLTPDHFDFGRTTGRILHLGLPGLHARMDAPWGADANGWTTVLRSARAAGLQTNLEVVSVERERIAALVCPCLPWLDTLVVNDYEIGAIAGLETVPGGTTDIPACRRAAQQVLQQGRMDVVVVHYMQGAQLVARDGTELQMPSVKVPEAQRQGANGAGDAFAAGFLYGRHQGWSHADCLRLAHAGAAACLRSIGTTDSVESVEHCLELARAWGWR